MVKIYSYVAGETLGTHEAILKKLIKRGAQKVDSPEDGDVTIVFCPIVSRFEADVNSALEEAFSKIPRNQEVILVAMHHSFDRHYTFPNRELNHPVSLSIHCLFHEKKGLLDCSCNKEAYNRVYVKLGLSYKRDKMNPMKKLNRRRE